MHDLLVAFDPQGHDVRADVRLQDQPRDAPFEIPHRLVRVLVHAAFGVDVDPAVAARGVRSGRGEGVAAVGGVGVGVGVGGGGRGEGVRKRERGWDGGEGGPGEQADGFEEGGLEEPAVRVFVQAVRGEDLAEDEEGGHGSVGWGVWLDFVGGDGLV